MYKIVFYKKAEKDLKLIRQSPLKKQLYNLLEVLETDPFAPPYEKLQGTLKGLYSRRINIQHRLVYEVNEETETVTIYSAWTHYGD